MKIILLVLALFFTNVCYAQEKVVLQELPNFFPVSELRPVDPNLSWYRWKTKNFIIHSVDVSQGEKIYELSETIKTNFFYQWGLEDFDFSCDTAIFIAPNKEMMKELFNLDYSCAESRVNGDTRINYMWIILDKDVFNVAPSVFGMICLSELENKYKFKMDWWMHRGVNFLSLSPEQIRERILSSKSEFLPVDKFFNTNQSDWNLLNKEAKRAFDDQAMFACLMVRKEYGQFNFQHFMKRKGIDSIKLIGFNDQEFNKVLTEYASYLKQDVVSGKAPMHYLQINRAKE